MFNPCPPLPSPLLPEELGKKISGLPVYEIDIDAVYKTKSTAPAPCNWGEDNDGNWFTACGEAFVLNDATPAANGMRFCCYCGKPLTERPFDQIFALTPSEAPADTAPTFDGYADFDEVWGDTIEEYVAAMAELNADDGPCVGETFTVDAIFSRGETWKILSIPTREDPTAPVKCERVA